MGHLLQTISFVSGSPDAVADELASVGWSPKANACVGYAWLRGERARQACAGTPAQVELWGEPVGATVWDTWPPVAPGLTT